MWEKLNGRAICSGEVVVCLQSGCKLKSESSPALRMLAAKQASGVTELMMAVNDASIKFGDKSWHPVYLPRIFCSHATNQLVVGCVHPQACC